MKLTLFLFIVLSFTGGNLQAQPPVGIPQSLDSLEWFLRTQPVDTAYAIAMKDCAFGYVIKGKYAQADSLCQQLGLLRKKMNYIRIDYFIPFIKGTLAYHKQDRAATLENYLKALKVVQAHPSRFTVATLNSITGNVATAYKKLDNLDMAMRYELDAIRIQEKHHIENASAYLSIANILVDYHQYDRSLSYYTKALKIYGKQNDVKGIAIVESKLGTLYDFMHKPDTAIAWYRRGLRHAEQASYPLLQTDFLVNLGLLYTGKKQYKQAEAYLKRGEKLSRELESPGALRVNLHNQGELYRDMEKFDIAEKCYLEALALAKKTGDFEELYTSNQALAELYIDTDSYEKSYPFLKAAAVAKDSTFQAILKSQSQQLLAQYESEKRQQQIALLNEKNRSQSLELAVQRRNVGLLVAGLLMSGVFGTVGYRRYRLRKRLEMEQIRNRIAADFHDELGANLSSIALYSDLLLKNASTEKEKALPILENISQQAHGSISSINDLIWTIKPDNDVLERTIVRMKEFANPLLESRDIGFVFEVDDSLPQAHLSMNMRKFLYLIFKEAINNAAKYSRASVARVRLQERKGMIQLEIADDGVGFDAEQVQRGNGLNNMQVRARELGGKLSVDSQAGKGTRIVLSFRPVL